jgi:branched-chain amino acid aminotransferase
MFLMDYTEDKGWHDGRIVPYADIPLDPSAAVLHYAIEMFEGMKAYKTADDRVLMFRPEMNAKRANITNDRLCIAQMDEELFLSAVKTLVDFEKDWIPQGGGKSLYIRPFIIANDVFLGLRPATRFLFVVFLCPVASYYPGGLKPTKLLVEEDYIRAAPGGTGYAKVGGNYAATLRPQKKAMDLGCDQVLFLDGIEKKYIEEVGASNAFFVIDGEVLTAPAGGTILDGVTRNSVLQLLKKWGYKATERRVSIDEVYEAFKAGKLNEAFATGTAAVISPIGELVWGDKNIVINDKKTGEISQKLYDELYGIQTGEKEDHMGWTVEVK